MVNTLFSHKYIGTRQFCIFLAAVFVFNRSCLNKPYLNEIILLYLIYIFLFFIYFHFPLYTPPCMFKGRSLIGFMSTQSMINFVSAPSCNLYRDPHKFLVDSDPDLLIQDQGGITEMQIQCLNDRILLSFLFNNMEKTLFSLSCQIQIQYFQIRIQQFPKVF